jgi:catechol 2,3-dioxygenase-like lactoylglutathione lyase family enzyme
MNDNPTTTDFVFDHVAIAVERITDLWPTFAAALGGRYVDRGIGSDFEWTQLRFANGFVIEGLQPVGAENGAFLHRFLARNGPGPHHITFKVPDLDAALARVREAGLSPVAENRDDPLWLEAFLHPREAHGIVVQLAQLGDDLPPPPPEPEGFPDLAYDHPVASLGRVVHAVADLDAAATLYRDVLGGRVVSTGSAVDGNHWIELAWAGPGRLRLLEATNGDIADWVGDRPGRLRHLYFNHDEPSWVPDVHQVAPARWVVDDDVFSTRLVIAPVC